MRTENLAIAFVDIKAFTTRTSSQSREENQELLKRFESVVRPVVRALGGKVVKSIGDAYLITFRSPTDALHAAMAMQDRLAELNGRSATADRFEIRVAVNAGEVRVEPSDVFGEAVNIASRIESLADGGEIYFSEAVYLVMNKSEIPYEEVGVRTLKGIPEPVRIYRVPRIPEIGAYRVKGSGRPIAAPEREHPLEPAALPFGGKALDRVRSRLPEAGAADTAVDFREMTGKLKTAGVEAQQHASRLLDRFQAEWRRSPQFRYVVLAAAALLLILIVWAAWPRKTPKSRFKRALGELGLSWSPPAPQAHPERAAANAARVEGPHRPFPSPPRGGGQSRLSLAERAKRARERGLPRHHSRAGRSFSRRLTTPPS